MTAEQPEDQQGQDVSQFPPAQAPQRMEPQAPQETEATQRPPSKKVVANGLQMKRRNPWAVWGLMLLTLGVYYLIWWYKIHAEMAQYDQRQHINPAVSLSALIFGAWWLIPGLVSTAAQGGRISRAQRAAGLSATCSGGLGVLLWFIFGLVAVYYQSELNKVIDSYWDAYFGDEVPLYK